MNLKEFRTGGQQRGRFLRPTHALKKTRVSLTGVRNDISHWIQHGVPKVSDISRGRLRSIKIFVLVAALPRCGKRFYAFALKQRYTGNSEPGTAQIQHYCACLQRT